MPLETTFQQESLTRTEIYKFTSAGEIKIGYVGDDQIIYRTQSAPGGSRGEPVGRVDASGKLFRYTAHDERELGTVTADGQVRSHGLFEGGELGWVAADGTVVQAGLIFGEEEVGRVEGPQAGAAGAALLLLFLPDDAETKREMER